MKEIHFPWEAESGEVYANYQFLRELTAWAQTASRENYRLSFSMERPVVPEKHNVWGPPHTVCRLCGYSEGKDLI